jgi:hypothetical protein
MAKGKGLGIVLIIAIVVGAILIGPTLLGAGSNFLGNFGKFTGDKTNGDGLNGYSGVNFLLTFDDGHTEEIKATDTQYSFFPLAITFNGADLTRIDVSGVAYLEGAPIGAYTITSTMKTELYRKPSQTPLTSASASYNKQGDGNLATSYSIQAASYSVTASTLEGICKTGGNGNFLLQVYLSSKIDVWVGDTSTNANNKEEQHYEASAPAGGVDFSYTSGTTTTTIPRLSSFSVKINTVPVEFTGNYR